MGRYRAERMNEEMKNTLSSIIFEMKDPRVSSMTTVTETNVTQDLKYCKVLISVYDKDEAVRKQTVDALNHAAGHIGWEVGKRMEIRAVPKFKFQLDDSIAYSIHIAEILNTLDIPKEEEHES